MLDGPTTVSPTPSDSDDWGDLGGYELEGRWEAAAQRSVKTPVDDFGTRTIGELSGGERKRLVLDVLLSSGRRRAAARRARQLPRRTDSRLARRSDQGVQVDDPDGQSRPHAAVERRHQGDLRRGHRMLGARRLVPHVPEARAKRQEQLGDDLQRWKDEERRLYRHMKIMKQRAAQQPQPPRRPTPPRPAGRSSSRPDLPAARSRPADPGQAARRRRRPTGRPAHRRVDRRPVPPLQSRDLPR